MLSETSDISGQRAANTVKLCKVNSHETSTNITHVGRLTLILFMTLHNLQITQYSHFTVVSSSSTTSQILRRYSEQALPSFDLDHPWSRVNCQQTVFRQVFGLSTGDALSNTNAVHVSHLKGFSPVRVHTCFFRSSLWAKHNPHESHVNGFAPVWVHTCLFKCPFWAKQSIIRTTRI